ncbi:MAG: 4-hydroxy-3-methylbut-2-enyl diphosphate reductase [Planctomycetaceae bacterium]
MKILLAGPHGFCAGVVMAIRALERALELIGPPLYVFHEIVHNHHVVEQFRGRGVVFVDAVADVPRGECLIYSAHGVSPQVRAEAQERGLWTIDATCPLVAKVHAEAVRFARQGYTLVLIGHAGHDEVAGTIGEAPEQTLLVESPEDVDRLEIADPQRVAYLTQTTLSVDDAERIVAALKRRFPSIIGPSRDDICYATQNRQEAVRTLASEADVVLVVGSRNSSNSLRLTEVAGECGVPAHLVEDCDDLRPDWFIGVETVLLTAGASAPEHLVTGCIERLQEWYAATLDVRTVREEAVAFPLPLALR